MKRLALFTLGSIFFVTAASAQDTTVTLQLNFGKSSKQAPVRIPLALPANIANPQVTSLALDGQPLPGQLTAPGIVSEATPAAKDALRRDLHLVVSEIVAGKPMTLTCKIVDAPKEAVKSAESSPAFYWKDVPGQFAELSFKDRPVLRYMYKTYDDSSKDARNKSYKVFHHLYDPDGQRFVTNGGHTDPYTDEKRLVFPHHRGLMFGFNRVSYGKGLTKKADTWHCPKEYVAHVKFLNVEAGPVLGRHRVLLDWVGPDKTTFAQEEREMTVYNVPGGTLVEFATRLKTTGGAVLLDGDPQHAGFQFRAANEVAEKTKAQTYYLRPDSKGKPGETRNWEPKTKQGPVDLPWHGLSFVLGKQRYSVAYVDHPTNPGEKRYSERDYGRFGCYFEYKLTEENPLVLNHRVWLQKGEMTQEQVQALREQFLIQPKITLK
ncbi:MAG: PmoA family protein [Gemmataceae bacterium]|nr:PmoA family protein [Gemmataceae bacterium]